MIFQLSTCVCAVATALVSSLHNSAKLQQFTEVGVLLQVESLISTYSNELAMLQVGELWFKPKTLHC